MTRWVVAVVLLISAGAGGDALVLTDGTRLEGEVTKTPEGWTITSADGKRRTVSPAQLAKVELTGAAEASAADKLASLKRAVEPLTDIDQIIQRFERFAAANPNTAAAEQARDEIATWTARKSSGMVKVGSRWISPAERDELRASIHPQIERARKLMRAGQLTDAQPLIDQVQGVDPANFSAMYLQGLLQFEQEKLPQARKSFEQVEEQIAGHAPTLNNLAVINLRQNQLGAAMNYFDQAMLAAPADRAILDNVAEALNSAQEERGRMPIMAKVARRFAEQDAALAAQLREKGLFRWGASWVNKRQFDQLVAAEKAIEEKVRRFKTDFELIGAQLGSVQRQIEDSERTLERIRQDSWFIDTEGRLRSMQLPAYFYDEQRRHQQLQSERAQLLAQRKALREQSERVKQDLPVPRYTGVQKLIGEEGTPVEPPSTQPES